MVMAAGWKIEKLVHTEASSPSLVGFSTQAEPKEASRADKLLTANMTAMGKGRKELWAVWHGVRNTMSGPSTVSNLGQTISSSLGLFQFEKIGSGCFP
jgi:hypothetical protein